MSSSGKKPQKRRTRANTRAIADAVEQLGGISKATVRKVRQITGGSLSSVQKRIAAIRGRQMVEVQAVRSMRSQVRILQGRMVEAIVWATAMHRIVRDLGIDAPTPPVGLIPENERERPSLPIVVPDADDEVAP